MDLQHLDDNKLYYTITEVAEMFEVNASLIRYWEKEFPIIKPKKNKKGNRVFTKTDIENFHMIYHLGKERGMTLGMMASDIEQRVDFDAMRKYKVSRIQAQLEAKDLGRRLPP